MPDDTAELCCASDICCDPQKSVTELAELLTRWCGHHITAGEAANAIKAHFDLVPKELGFGPAFMALAKMAREHPYE